MRVLLILLFFCIDVRVQAQIVFNNKNPFRLTGRIDHYTPTADNGFFNIKTYSINGRPVNTAIPITKDGYFEGNLSLVFSGDVEASYEEVFFKLYATPGDSLHVIIDGNSWKKAAKPAEAIQLTGNRATLTILIQDFEKAYRTYPFKTMVDWNDKAKTDQEVVLTRLNRMKEELKFAEDYLKVNHISDHLFSTWANNNIRYAAGYDIVFTSFTASRNKTLSIEQLVALLKDIPVNDSSALHNSLYYKYISVFESSMEIIVNINPAFDAAKKQNGLNSVPIYLDNIDAHFKGLGRQLMYYYCYLDNHRSTGGYEDRFDAVIRNPSLAAQWRDSRAALVKPFEALNVAEAVSNFKGDELSKSRLLSIFEAQKGKHVFITFWGTWCGPCMGDMPGFPDFINQFTDNEPVFLFLGVETKEEASKAVQKKYGIRGTFITLTNNEASILNSVLKFRSYPAHFLLKPNSSTTNCSVSRVRTGDNTVNMAAVKKVKQILEAGKE